MIRSGRITALFLCAAFAFSGCAGQKFFPGPSVMPNTARDMKVPAFWISLQPNPDKVIMNAKAIKRFNRNIQDNLQLTTDLAKMADTYSGVTLRKEFQSTLDGYKKGKLYTKEGIRVRKDFFANIEQNIKVAAIPDDVPVAYALVSHYAPQRILPVSEGVYSSKLKQDFDALQNNSIDIGSPAAVLGRTLDGKWFYIQSQYSAGWVESENLVLCSKKQMLSYAERKSFAVVIKAKGQIMLDPGLVKYFDYVRMGSRLPLTKKNSKTSSGAAVVIIPSRAEDGSFTLKKAYIKEKDINRGYVPYTPRNIITEAFEMRDTVYGWGGLNGEQDCSGFIQQVFATTGINLPKNSFSQSEVGEMVRTFNKKTEDREKIDALQRSAVGGASILYFGGHVMLFLGEINDNPFVIHDLWGYTEKNGGPEQVRVVNHIVVSDLSLGQGTKKGSLLKRLKSIRTIS